MKTAKEEFDDFCAEFKASHQILDRLMPEKALSIFAIEFAKRYARQCCEDLRQRCADGLIPIQTNFLTESREMQEQPGSEYGKTLLEGQIIGAMSVGEASYHAILEAEIILP